MAYVLVDEDQLEAGLKTVCDSIRGKTGGTDQLEFPLGMKAAVDSIEQGGGDIGGVDMMRYILSPTFAADVKEIKEPIVLHLERATSLGNMLDLKVINAPKVTVYISDKCTTMYRAFGRGGGVVEVIEIIGDTSNVDRWESAFNNKPNLREIIADLDFSSATVINNIFDADIALRKFSIVPNTLSLSLSVKNSPDLTDDTIQSLVDGYKDMTGQTSPVLTLHPYVKARLIDVQKATLTKKNVTIA